MTGTPFRVKTLHLTHTEIDYDSRILKEMGALAGAGYVVEGIGILANENLKTKRAAPIKARIDSVKLFSRRLTFLPRILRHAITLTEFFLRVIPMAICRRPGVVHCHDTLVLPVGCIVKLVTGAKVVYDAHELESNRNGQSRFLGNLTLYTEKFFWPFIDTLIVVSPSIENWYLENLGYKRSAVILNSPLLSEEDEVDGDYLRSKFSIPKDSKVFLYIGILGKGRGIDLLVEAFSDSRISSHLVFLGYGELSHQLEEIAAKKVNIHVHSPVPHSQVVLVAKTADVGLCLVENISLSDYYCLPNKLFEYCFSKIPIIASNFPDIRAVVEKHSVGICCDLNISDIQQAILNMEHENFKFTFESLEQLSWQSQENRLLNVYKQTIK